MRAPSSVCVRACAQAFVLPSVRAAALAVPLLIPGGCSEPADSPELAWAVIGPDGGIITSADDVLTIAIPPGALERSTEIFIERSDEPPEVFGQAYLVRPNPALRYDVTVTYRQELPDDPSGLSVGGVDALEFQARRGRWEPLPVLRVDPEAKLISGIDDGLSIFYALLDDSDASPSPPATTSDPDDPGDATTTGP